jgi:ABC-2 type transport system permease protein
MHKIIDIARREYRETVKTKAFLLSLLLAPLLIVAIVLLGRTNQPSPAAKPSARVAVIDQTGQLEGQLRQALQTHNASGLARQLVLESVTCEPNDPQALLDGRKQLIREGQLDVCVVVDRDAVSGRGWMHVYGREVRVADLDLLQAVQSLVNRAVFLQRCRARDVSPQLVEELDRRVPAEQKSVGPAPGQERSRDEIDMVTTAMVPFAFMFMMFMGIFAIGQTMLTSILEEKSSRVMEVLLSSVTPLELMGGKILGLGAVGLTVVGVWGASAYGAARWQGVAIVVPPAMLGYFVVYYVLGFLLFCAILAGIGSVCNTTKDAQALMAPLTLIVIVPMVTWFNLAQEPQGALAVALSLVPPMTPMVMILRLSADPGLPILHVLISLAVLGVSVPVAIWASAKVFRVGVLMYGKRPRLREIMRWIRQG